MKTMKQITRLLACAVLLLGSAIPNLPAAEQHTATWTGGNSFRSYSATTNWDLGELPVNNSGTNYVVLVNPNDSLVFDRLGGAAISSMNLGKGSQFRMANNTALSVLNAGYVGGVLEALNTNTTFQAQAFGTTFGPEARVLVANGSQVTISGTPGSRYDWTSHYGPATVFSVSGTNSLLNLSDLGVLSMNGYYFDSPKIVEAINGGRLNLSSLTTVTGARSDSSRLQFRVANGGVMDLPQLRIVDGRTWFRMEVPDYTLPSLQTAQDTYFDLPTNTILRLPSLNAISGGSSYLSVRSASTLEATNLLSFADGGVDLASGGTVHFPRMTTFQNSRLDLTPGKSWNAPPLQRIDNSRFAVSGGAVLGVAATTYDWTYHYGDSPLFTAEGTNSLLDLKSLQRLSLNQYYFGSSEQKIILANNYGKIDLSGLVRVVGARSDSHPLLFRFANGGNIDLSSLEETVARTRFQVDWGNQVLPALRGATNTTFGVAGGCTLRMPVLESLNSGGFNLAAGATLDVPALQTLIGDGSTISIAFVASNNAPNLVSINNAPLDIAVAGTMNVPQLRSFTDSTLSLSPGKTFIAAPLTNIDNSSISVSGSNTLAIAALDYNWTYHYGRSTVFAAEGDGCILNLSSLRRLNFNYLYSGAGEQKLISSRVNARLDLSNLDEVFGARNDSYPVLFRAESGGQIEFGDTVLRSRSALQASGETSRLKARSLALPPSTTLSLVLNSTLQLSRGLSFSNTIESEVNMDAGRVSFVGGGAKFLEVGGTDTGTSGTPTANFGCARLSVGTDGQKAVLRLVDLADNGNRVAGGPEALYLLGDPFGRSLELSAGSVLVLNNINVYALVGGQMIRLNSLIPAGTNSVPFDEGFLANFGGPRITNMTPSVAVTPAVSSVDVAFDLPIASSSFTPADVSITGPSGAIPATGVALVSGTTWRISFAAQSADGTYTVRVGPNINELGGNLNGLDQNQDGLSGDGTNDTFAGTFVIDGTAPVVVSAYGLQNGTRVGVTFNEPVSAAFATNLANYSVNGLTPTNVVWFPGGSGILREVFSDISGNYVSNLTSAAAFPHSPSSTNLVTHLFESPRGFADNYGQRLHGYIVPPVTGNYTFWVASDDGSALYLSTDENPASQALIATTANATGWRNWTSYASQQSAPVWLVAGRRYYISALQKEGSGDDYLSVRWLRPDGVDEGPIPAAYLVPFGADLGASRVALAVPPLVGDSFTLTVNNLADRLANTANRVFTGAMLPLSPRDIGIPSDPREPGATVAYNDSAFDMVAGGSGIWYDYGHFVSEQRTGDFDTAVRIHTQTRPGSWTQSGIMARETLDATSRQVYAGIQYGTGYDRFAVIYRATTGGGSDYWPNSIVNTVPIPNAWLRLKREGSVFISSRSTNGVDWIELARMTNSLPTTLYVGLASSANNNNVGGTTSAQYRDYREISPAIMTQPQSQSVASGANVTFAVTARGLPTLAYQWQLNGIPLPGETGSSLTLLAVNTNRVGNYRVVVSNPYGTNTSQEATLIVDGIGQGGFEADLSPAPLGNNVVTVSDWVKVGRLVVGLDTPLNSSEFTRADCAPRTNALLGTLPLGDGRLSVADWTQAGRYAAAVDPLTAAGGPTEPMGGAPGINGGVIAGGRAPKDGSVRSVRLVGSKVAAGASFTVPVELLALGGENALGFSLQYDPAQLAYQGLSLGDGAAGATLQVNASQAGAGAIGVVLAKSVGQGFAAGTAQVARVQFKAVGPAGTNKVDFGDAPVWREIADVGAEVQPAAYVAGTVRVVAPGVLSGDVRFDGGAVELRLTGEPGERYRVEVSPDLVQWSAVSTVTAGASPVIVRDPAGAGAQQRFYRAVLVP